MEHDFGSIMSKKSDEELITILTVGREDYAEAALLAAQDEFKKRSVPDHYFEEIVQEQTIIRERHIQKANEPLDSDTKILATLLPLVASFMYAEKFGKEGYDRKLAEMGKAAWRGRAIYVCTVVGLNVMFKSCG